MFTQADKRKLLETMKELDENEPVKIEQLEAITTSAQARLETMEQIKQDTQKVVEILDLIAQLSIDQRKIQTALVDLQVVAWPQMQNDITQIMSELNVIKSDMALVRESIANMQADVTAIKDAVVK